MLKLWQLLDYRGKQRLQFLVFPQGMRYNRQNDQVLIPEVNKILFSIAGLSKVLEKSKNENSTEDREKLGFLYTAFVSSNFFWTELMKLVEFSEYLENVQSTIWKAINCGIYDPFTEDTRVMQCIYISDTTDTLHQITNSNFNLFDENVKKAA
jgi:hypothetical protein